MMSRSGLRPSLVILTILALSAPGCLSYRTYQVETGGPVLVLRRVDAAHADAGERELALQPVNRGLQRTVESLQGKRVRFVAPGHGNIDGNVVGVTGAILHVQGQRPGSAIDNARPDSYDIDLVSVDTIDVSDSKGEATLMAAVAVGTLAGLLALVLGGLRGMGN